METVKLEKSRDGKKLKWRRAKMEMSQNADRLAGRRMEMRDEEVRREEGKKEREEDSKLWGGKQSCWEGVSTLPIGK